jgi:hypothetical protein
MKNKMVGITAAILSLLMVIGIVAAVDFSWYSSGIGDTYQSVAIDSSTGKYTSDASLTVVDGGWEWEGYGTATNERLVEYDNLYGAGGDLVAHWLALSEGNVAYTAGAMVLNGGFEMYSRQERAPSLGIAGQEIFSAKGSGAYVTVGFAAISPTASYLVGVIGNNIWFDNVEGQQWHDIGVDIPQGWFYAEFGG